MKKTTALPCLLALFISAFGCQPTPIAEPASEPSESVGGGEPLEGTKYEPSGLESNPARPRSARPEPP